MEKNGNVHYKKIQIQHLLKLNSCWRFCVLSITVIQIQHLLKLNSKEFK